jgi:hypothetical protein
MEWLPFFVPGFSIAYLCEMRTMKYVAWIPVILTIHNSCRSVATPSGFCNKENFYEK